MSVIAYQSKKESKAFIRQMEPHSLFALKEDFLNYIKAGDFVISDVDLLASDIEAINTKGAKEIVVIKSEDDAIAFWRKVAAAYDAGKYGPTDLMGRPIDFHYPWDGNTILWKKRELEAVDTKPERPDFFGRYIQGAF